MADLTEVEIIDKPIVETKEEVVILDGLDDKEKDLATKQGVKEVVPVEDKEEKDFLSSEEKEARLKEMEAEEKETGYLSTKKYSKEERGMYGKYKVERNSRQEAQREYELSTVREKALKKELESLRSNHDISDAKLKKVNELLTGPQDNITIEAIQAILAQSAQADDSDDRPLTKKDLNELSEKQKQEQREFEEKQKFVVGRINSAESIGKSKYDNFDDAINMAQEVINGKIELPDMLTADEIAKKLNERIANKELDPEKVADFVVSIAKLNPNFGKKQTNPASQAQRKETDENIDRIIKNASKATSSAAVNGGNGRRMVSLENLTVDDAAKLTPKQWGDLPANVRKRILSQQ